MTAAELEKWQQFKGMEWGDKELYKAATASAEICGNIPNSAKQMQ
jgi:hypothetical protein